MVIRGTPYISDGCWSKVAGWGEWEMSPATHFFTSIHTAKMFECLSGVRDWLWKRPGRGIYAATCSVRWFSFTWDTKLCYLREMFNTSPFSLQRKKKKKCLNTALHTLDGITPLGGRLLQPNLWGRRSEKCWFETYYVNFFLSLLQTASLREMSQQSPLFLSSCKSLVCSN